MALAKFARVCAKNISGCQAVYVADQALITVITVTAGEISALTGALGFKEIEADVDSISWDTTSEKVGIAGIVFKNVLKFVCSKMTTLLNTLRTALADGSPCGYLAIVTDGNGKNWLVGYTVNDLKTRPLRLQSETGKTGKGLSEADGNTVEFSLENECGGICLPLDATQSAAVNAGTAAYVDYQT